MTKAEKQQRMAVRRVKTAIDDVVDPRFDAKKDPRFRRMPTKDRKVVLDSRFERILKEAKFSTLTKVDPFGRSRSEVRSDELEELYLASNDSHEEAKNEKELADRKASPVIEPPDCSFHVSEDSKDVGCEAESTSASEESDDSDGEKEIENSSWVEIDENVERSEAVTPRLALLRCDWDNVSASDLYMLFQSYVQGCGRKGGADGQGALPSAGLGSESRVLKVSVHPSEIGKKQMDFERINGPQIVDEQEFKNLDSEESKNIAIRRYQKQRSDYYYAIIDCSDIATARYLYDEMDGLDSDFSLGGLDLRFVPDKVVAPYAAVSECTKAPARFESVTGSASALRHCQATCTWDQPSRRRVKHLKLKKFTDAELEELDMKDFLADEKAVASDGSIDETEAYEFQPPECLKAQFEESALKDSASVVAAQADDAGDVDRYRRVLLGELADRIDASSEEETNKPTKKETYNQKKLSLHGASTLDISFGPKLSTTNGCDGKRISNSVMQPDLKELQTKKRKPRDKVGKR
eukprot:GHVN01069189.1.p1 GENE.GHVN01069189.1~~GHVN01069189.1.p1  ORF type:complete len:534 (+),score=65.85 GHVN01069189.1:35-1603(+)